MISEGEKPSSSILDISVDHKEIMKQPSADDSAALKGDDTSAKVSQDAGIQEREFSVPEVISEDEKPSSSILDISVDHKEIMKQPSTDDSAALKGDDTSAKVSQDAGVQEREFSVPEVISEDEKPSSSILDISVDHKEIMKQPSTDDSAALKGDDTSAKVSQDAGVQEREFSVPEVISEDEKPSSSILDISVDHKEIMKQPSTDDSAALKGVAQDFTKIEEKPGPEPTVTTLDHSLPDSSNLQSSEIPVSIVSTDATSISVGLENKISSQEPGVFEKMLDSTPRDVIGIDSQPESRLIEDETQIFEKPKGIDIPIGSPQAGVVETDTWPGDDAIEGSKEKSITDHDLETGDEPLPSSDKSDKDEIVSLDRDVSGNVEIVLPHRSQTEGDVKEPNELFGDSIEKSDVDIEPLFDNDVADVSPSAGVDSNASVLSKDKVIASDQLEGLGDISQNESQSRKIRVQDAGESEKINASIRDEELSSEEPYCHRC